MAGSVVTDARPARAHDHTTRTGAGGWLVPLPAWLPGAASPALLTHSGAPRQHRAASAKNHQQARQRAAPARAIMMIASYFMIINHNHDDEVVVL